MTEIHSILRHKYGQLITFTLTVVGIVVTKVARRAGLCEDGLTVGLCNVNGSCGHRQLDKKRFFRCFTAKFPQSYEYRTSATTSDAGAPETVLTLAQAPRQDKCFFFQEVWGCLCAPPSCKYL